MGHVHAVHYLEQFAGQMSRISTARRGHADLAGIGLRIGNEFRDAFGGNGWMHYHHEWPAYQSDKRNVSNKVEAKIGIKCCVYCGGSVRANKSIAIGGGGGGGLVVLLCWWG